MPRGRYASLLYSTVMDGVVAAGRREASSRFLKAVQASRRDRKRNQNVSNKLLYCTLCYLQTRSAAFCNNRP